MPDNLLFLTLRTFSATGGIEKVCRVASKAYKELCNEHKWNFRLYSMHDEAGNSPEPYIDKMSYFGFGGKRIRFVWKALLAGKKSGVVVLSHINLALPGLLIKLFSSSAKVILMAHGIDVWDRKLSFIQKKLLQKADLITAVSTFTKNRLCADYQLNNIIIINNCLDPFLPTHGDETIDIRGIHNLGKEDFIILTVTRLAFTEVKKNYDSIIRTVAQLRNEIPGIRYLLIGKYDPEEKKRLKELVGINEVENRVIFAGFVPDEVLPSYYESCDLYVMPSKKEGFGLTFIEAAYYGLPVISGNKDGSTDALLNGRLGIMIDPDNEEALRSAIALTYNNRESFNSGRELVVKHFGFDVYKRNWNEVLFSDVF